MKFSLVDATEGHAICMSCCLRQEDNEEWVAASGRRTKDTLMAAVRRGRARAIVDEWDDVFAIWGVHRSDIPGVGLAWMIANDRAVERVHSMHRFFKQGIEEMHAQYPTLHAWAYSKNVVHHRWMRRMGFVRVPGDIKMGLGFNFILFTRTADNVR